MPKKLHYTQRMLYFSFIYKVWLLLICCRIFSYQNICMCSTHICPLSWLRYSASSIPSQISRYIKLVIYECIFLRAKRRQSRPSNPNLLRAQPKCEKGGAAAKRRSAQAKLADSRGPQNKLMRERKERKMPFEICKLRRDKCQCENADDDPQLRWALVVASSEATAMAE